MKEAKNRERINATEMKDFLVKVYECNGEPEFLQSKIINISEDGLSGFCDNSTEIKEGDSIAGVIEGEDFQIKIRYIGSVSWVRQGNKGQFFGIEFLEEITLPDILIARLMAVA